MYLKAEIRNSATVVKHFGAFLVRFGHDSIMRLFKLDRPKVALEYVDENSPNFGPAIDQTPSPGGEYDMRRKTILIINQYFPPDRSATAGVLSRIVSVLANTYNTKIIAGRPSYRPEKIEAWSCLKIQKQKATTIIRVGSTSLSRVKIIGRVLNYCSYLLLSLPAALLIRADLIVAMTDPPLAGMIAAIAAAIKRKPFVYYIQDLHPDMAIAAGMIRTGALSKVWEKIHCWVMSRADTVIVLGEDMKDRISDKGIEATKTVVIRHGAKPPQQHPILLPSVIEKIRCGLGMAVVHAGNIGHYGAWDTLVRAAEKLKNSEAGIVFVGEGAAKADIIKRSNGNDRIKFIPFRPRAEFVNVLEAGDMHLVTIRPGLEGTIVPSKLYPIISAGRPVLAVVPCTSDVAKIITQSKCGVVVDPLKPDALAEVILGLLRNPEKLAEMGRRSKAAARKITQAGEINKLIKIFESYTG